ncbi:MAG: hypothetical protein RQ736_13475 [Thiogranum sp.]|nr:hypothetical protein [Thiogranum sp.]
MDIKDGKLVLQSLSVAIATLLFAACGGGGSGDDGSTSVAVSAATVSGTVPGTTIEAFADNGGYYVTHSTDNGTTEHPFSLEVPAGMGLRLIMTTNEGTADEVISPIGFRDNTAQEHTRIVLGDGDSVTIGHVPLALNRAQAAGDVDGDGDNDDIDADGVLDSPFMLDDAQSPLGHADADRDGMNDFDDPDHGGYQYSGGDQDPLDHDNDGVPNTIDPHYMPASGFTDSDRDGLHDETNDVNPGNIQGMNTEFMDDLNRDGFHDGDDDRDGFHDDDLDRDGFHDDDLDRDGFHDGDMNFDGFHDDDMDRDGMRDVR